MQTLYKTSWWKYSKKLLMYLLLVIVALIFIGPFLWMLGVSFMPNTQNVYTIPPSIIPNPPVFDNFINAWTSIPYGRYMLNSFILLAIMVPAHVIISALAAYPLARMNFPGRNFIFLAILGTMFLPDEGRLVPLYLIVQDLGMTNSWLGVIMPGIAGGLAVFLMRQSYIVIPREIEDAAIIDGCGPFRLWWSIMLPMTKPALATVAVFAFVSVWEAFIWPLIVLNDNDLYPIALGLNYLTGTFGDDVRTLTAGVAISLVPIVIFFLFAQRYFIEGLQGAVKQ